MSKAKILQGFEKACYKLGIDITVSRSIKQDNAGFNLINVGAGRWSCDGWINLDYSSPWYASIQNKQKYIEYDIRKDTLPFPDDSIDCIYCSHVIEHIENAYIKRFFSESYRVLKKGGVIRIACPDAEFLWNMTKAGKQFWIWRKPWCEQMKIDFSSIRAVDLLVREVATPKMLGYGYLASEDYLSDFENMNMIDFYEKLTDNLTFNVDHVGDHINYWTYDKAHCILEDVGFCKIYRSKYGGSISPFMKSKAFFDMTFPEMSLYFEAIK